MVFISLLVCQYIEEGVSHIKEEKKKKKVATFFKMVDISSINKAPKEKTKYVTIHLTMFSSARVYFFSKPPVHIGMVAVVSRRAPD